MWIYNDEEYVDTPEEYQGFVYVITELVTGKKYIGKKNFWRPKTLPKNSKRNRRVHVKTHVSTRVSIYFETGVSDTNRRVLVYTIVDAILSTHTHFLTRVYIYCTGPRA